MPNNKRKYRIVRYYDRFEAQICDEMYGNWKRIGQPNGYATVEDAKDFCKKYNYEMFDKVMEEFEL